MKIVRENIDEPHHLIVEQTLLFLNQINCHIPWMVRLMNADHHENYLSPSLVDIQGQQLPLDVTDHKVGFPGGNTRLNSI